MDEEHQEERTGPLRDRGKKFAAKAQYLDEEEARIAKVALYEYYGKASKEVIEDWFSPSKLLLIDDVCLAPENG